MTANWISNQFLRKKGRGGDRVFDHRQGEISPANIRAEVNEIRSVRTDWWSVGIVFVPRQTRAPLTHGYKSD